MTERSTQGRKQYSEALHQVILDNLREGRPKSLAFRLCGIHPDTVFRWLAMGRELPDKYPEYVRLAEDIDGAIAEAEAEALARIKAAAKSDPKHWTADAWYLERTNPAEYGKRDRVEIEAQRPLVQLNQLVLTDDEARTEARELLNRLVGRTALARRSDDPDVIDVTAEEVGDDDA